MAAFWFQKHLARQGDMELTFSRRALLAALAILLVLAGAAFFIWRSNISPPAISWPEIHSSPTSAPPSPQPPDLLTDNAAEEVVRETVTAYFTIDPADKAAWVRAMSKLAADPETVGILASSVWPAASRASFRSSPSSIAVRQVITGYDTVARRRWQVWQAQVSGLPSWPAPAPQPIGPFAIPWPKGDEASLYVTVVEQQGRWRFGLFPVDALVKNQLEAVATHRPGRESKP